MYPEYHTNITCTTKQHCFGHASSKGGADAICWNDGNDVDDDPGIVEPDELRNGRLPFLTKSNNNRKFVTDCRGEEE
jgi:hypothetical protein